MHFAFVRAVSDWMGGWKDGIWTVRRLRDRESGEGVCFGDLHL